MINLQQKKWFWMHRSRLFLGSKEFQSSTKKFKGSLLAVLLGLIIGAIVIAATGNNAFVYFQYLFFFAFGSHGGYANWDNTMVWWAIYIIAGLALVVSFKTGMFNIGVAGQILAAGSVVLAIGIRYDFSQPIAIIVALIAGTLTAILVAAVTVLLKVLFNVHEVVTSILLNWTIWYLIKWLFTTSTDLYDSSRGSSLIIHDSMNFSIAGYKFILPLILAFILVVTVWFLLKKTTLGYKVKTIGLNPFAADYAGISRKKYNIISFIISGALAGVMGVIYYVTMNPSLNFANDNLPAIGFDSISVALVAQINAFGTVAAAFLWGLIKSGGPIGSVGLSIPNAVSDIIFAVIIYSAACAILLSKISPIKSLITYFNIIFSKARRKQYHFYLSNIWKNWMNVFKIRRSKLPKNNKKEQIQISYSQMQQEFQDLKNFFHQSYDNIWISGLIGIKNNATKKKKLLYAENLNQYIQDRISYEEKVYHFHHKLKHDSSLMKSKKDYLKNQIKIEKETFNQQFSNLINNEQKQLVVIKKQQKDDLSSYKKNKSSQETGGN